MSDSNQTYSVSSPCCCSYPDWVTGLMDTPAGPVPQVSVRLATGDILGTWKARWGINRMNYKVSPGLYCVGTPDSGSPVLVTANYKMSFDRLRSELEGVNAWIMVLDTKGINVWCAAGKGTFGTDELVRRIRLTGLSKVVSHRTVVLPQLGAPGVSAGGTAKESGFKVVYGPVRAEDVKDFLASGMKASQEMRTVKFTFIDRLALTPMELVNSIKPALIILGILFILNSTGIVPFGAIDLLGLAGAILCGAFVTPVLLPWIPFRRFFLKGWLIGILWASEVCLLYGWPQTPGSGWVRAASYILMLPALTAYVALNFTGCSTYTSPSGVAKEMKTAIPAIIASLSAGILLVLAQGLLGF